MQEYLAVLLISTFLVLTFVYSVIEKIAQWNTTTNYYTKHFKGSFLENKVVVSVIFVLVLELVSIGISLVGLYHLFKSSETLTLQWGLTAIAITLIVLMTGQRIAQDYSGAMNITVYFILTVMGIYML